MTKLSDLDMMRKLVDVKYRQQQESFARLMIQENRLRSSLHQLDEHLRNSRSSEDTSQKAIGADVVWQAWVGRKKRELNMQLAQILAMKEQHIEQVHKAYGKVVVTDKLFESSTDEQSKKKAQFELNRAITSMLF